MGMKLEILSVRIYIHFFLSSIVNRAGNILFSQGIKEYNFIPLLFIYPKFIECLQHIIYQIRHWQYNNDPYPHGEASKSFDA